MFRASFIYGPLSTDESALREPFNPSKGDTGSAPQIGMSRSPYPETIGCGNCYSANSIGKILLSTRLHYRTCVIYSSVIMGPPIPR